MQYVISDPDLKVKLDLLQELGIIRLIRDEQQMITGVEDILRLTESVEMLTGGQMHLKVRLAGNEYRFSEAETDNGRKLRRSLIRTGVVLTITMKDWNAILGYWLDIAERKRDISDDEDVLENALNFLRSSRIYTDITSTLGRYTLFYEPKTPLIVYCNTDALMKYLDRDDKRKMSSILSRYLDGPSVQKYVSKERKRYWKFDIAGCNLNLEDQMVDAEDLYVESMNTGGGSRAEGSLEPETGDRV